MPHDVRMPDGTIIRNVPEGTTKADLQRRFARVQSANKPTSFWQGFGEEVAKNGNNAARLISLINPVMSVAQTLSDLTGIGKDYTPRAVYQNNRRQLAEASARSKYQGSTLGRIVGGVVSTAPTMLIPGGVLAQGAAQGALSTDNVDDPRSIARDAAIGAIAGKAGEQVGKRLIAPAADRVGRTAPARAIAKQGANAINALTSQLPGNLPKLGALPLPAISKAESTVGKAAPDMEAIRQALADAQRLKLPYALADASPELRSLAGTATRRSPNAYALAEQTLLPRSRGQADRLVGAIDEHLAPVTDIRGRATDLVEGGKPVYGPLYEQAYEAPAITSPGIQAALETPAGREAVGRANTIAANEFRDPRAMGFALDERGNVVLNGAPVNEMDRLDAARQGWEAANKALQDATARQQASLTPGQFAPDVAKAQAALTAANAELDAAKAGMASATRSGTVQETPGYTTQSLDYVKRGIDDILEPQRNQITGKLNLDEGGRAILGVQRKLLDEMDAQNPAYGQARDAYSKFAKQAEALNTGHDVLPRGNLPERDFNRILERAREYDAALPEQFAGQTTVPEMQRGYATAMSDTADRMRMSGNPYEAVYGSPLQQSKVAALFPEGADNFNRIYSLEGDMAKTANEALGNSATARRSAFDELHDAQIGDKLSLGLQAAVNPKMAGLALAGQKLKDMRTLRSKALADQIAPILLDTSSPQAGMAFLADLARKQAEMETRKAAYQRAGGLFGRPAAVTAGLLAASGSN